MAMIRPTGILDTIIDGYLSYIGEDANERQGETCKRCCIYNENEVCLGAYWKRNGIQVASCGTRCLGELEFAVKKEMAAKAKELFKEAK